MKTRLLLTITTAAVMIVATPGIADDSYSFDVEFGYQWVDVSGNEDMYRSQVNQEDGFILGDLSIVSLKPEAGVYDRLRLDAAGFGGNPSGRLTFDLGLGKIYNLTFSYLTSSRVSYLPEFANPLGDQFIIPGQHTFDRTQDSFDIQLELLPGNTITPILGYRWTRIDGPGQTTYHVGQDEFQLGSQLEETVNEYYVGVAFKTGTFRGVLTQGWRSFESTENLQLVEGGEFGNNRNVVIGRDISLTEFSRDTRTEIDTPVTNFTLGGRVGEKFQLNALYVRADAEGETGSTEVLSGSLVSYRINRLFGGLDDSVSSRTENPSWRGELDLSYDFSDLVSADLSLGARNRSLNGWSMLSSLYLDTLTFNGMDPQDITRMADIRTTSERDESAVDLRITLGGANPVNFWVEGAFLSEDIDLDEDMAEIILPIGQEGSFEREITRYGAGAMVRLGSGRVMFDVQTEDGDNVVVRTDFTSRVRLRARAQFSIGEVVDILGTAETISADNLGSGVNFQASTDHVSLDLAIHPVDHLSFVFVWDDYTTESTVDYRVPHDFSVGRSNSVDDGNLLEGRIDLNFDKFDIAAGYTQLENDGSLQFTLDRFFARLSVDVTSHAALIFELDDYNYEEAMFSAADFDSSRYAVLVRLHR